MTGPFGIPYDELGQQQAEAMDRSDTPRTDEVGVFGNQLPITATSAEITYASFARQLERELEQARTALRDLLAQTLVMHPDCLKPEFRAHCPIHHAQAQAQLVLRGCAPIVENRKVTE